MEAGRQRVTDGTAPRALCDCVCVCMRGWVQNVFMGVIALACMQLCYGPVRFVIMAQTVMTEEHEAWKAVLVANGAPGKGYRHNVLARIMVKNCFSGLQDLAYADPPGTWLRTGNFADGEEEFLEELIKREVAKLKSGKQPTSPVAPEPARARCAFIGNPC